MLQIVQSLTIADHKKNFFAVDCQFDLAADKQLIFIYFNKIEPNYVGDTNASLNRNKVWKTELPAKKNQHTDLFSETWSPKICNEKLKSMENKFWNETRQLVLFAGTGKINLTVSFRKIDQMGTYYQVQSVNGFGDLAAGFGRAALPIARYFLWKIGRKLFVQAGPWLKYVDTTVNLKKWLCIFV